MSAGLAGMNGSWQGSFTWCFVTASIEDSVVAVDGKEKKSIKHSGRLLIGAIKSMGKFNKSFQKVV